MDITPPILALRKYRARLHLKKVYLRKVQEQYSLAAVVMLALVLSGPIRVWLELEVSKVTAPFWQQHSIKGKENADSLVNELRGGRVDVSAMTPTQLDIHMEDEASLRRRIRLARGLPDILPTPEAISHEVFGTIPVAGKREPSDATQVRVYGR